MAKRSKKSAVKPGNMSIETVGQDQIRTLCSTRGGRGSIYNWDALIAALKGVKKGEGVMFKCDLKSPNSIYTALRARGMNVTCRVLKDKTGYVVIEKEE